MITKLLPCPFCGGKAKYEQFANPKTSYSVRCTVCRCGTYGWDCPLTGTDAENKAMQAKRWNRRPEPKAIIPNKRIPGIGKCPTCKQELCTDDDDLHYCPTCGTHLITPGR